MQIIQSLLGTQVHTLGQKSYLGFHHQNNNFQHNTFQHNNFIQPLVISKPLLTPSRLFLNRKRQPFIDTLITDNYSDHDYLGNLDMNSDFPEMELANFDSITPEIIIPKNNTNSLTDTNNKFNLSNISHLLQTQIANNNLSGLSDDILPEVTIQPQTKTTRKTQKQKSQKKTSSAKTQPKKTQPKKTTKSSTTKKVKQVKVTQVIDESANHPPTAEENLNSLITDNPQSEILNLFKLTDNFTDSSPFIQQPTTSENLINSENLVNLDNNIIDGNVSNINSNNLDNNSTLSEQITDDEPQVITDLPSNLITGFNESDIIEIGEISIQAREQDRETDGINNTINSINSDSSEFSILENQTSNIEEEMNIFNNGNNFTNHQPIIVSETPEDVDTLDINVNENSIQREVEDENSPQLNIIRESDRDTRNINDIANDIYPAISDHLTKENLLSTSRKFDDNILDDNLDDNNDNLSNSLAPNLKRETDRNNLNKNSDLGEAESLVSDVSSNVIAENISPKSENKESLFIDFGNTQESVIVSDAFSPEIQDESVTKVTTLENTKKTVNTSEEISPIIKIQPNSLPQNEETTTPKILEITPVTSSPILSEIQLNAKLENNQIKSENQTSEIADVTTKDNTEITPITSSPILSEIQLNAKLENNQIKSENQTSEIADVTTKDNTEITP
ncbi:hypothetical protein, partial [Sphaerospermopsis reniformis]|uniref:hypothetical protein n=1 Tax=Sphaerospermopsis reniformis TaxID=531300 RepID=UPI0010FA5CC0